MENNPIRLTDPDGMDPEDNVYAFGQDFTSTGVPGSASNLLNLGNLTDASYKNTAAQQQAAASAVVGVGAIIGAGTSQGGQQGGDGDGNGGQPPKKKRNRQSFEDELNDRVKNAPHLKPITGWLAREWDFLNGGRDFNGIHYDADGNPTGPSINKMEMPFYISGPGDLAEAYETVAGYFVKGTTYMSGTTYVRTISILADGKGEGQGLFSLVKAFETTARGKGASEIVLKGTTVLNEGLFNAKIAARLGYTYKQIDAMTFEITKALK